MAAELTTDSRTGLISMLLSAAEERGVYAVLRFQSRRSRQVALEGSRVESVEANFTGGLGVQVFLESGHNGFAAVDDPDETRARAALERAVSAAKAAGSANLDPLCAIRETPALKDRAVPSVAYEFEDLDVGRMKEETERFAAEVMERAGEISVRTLFAVSRDDWRIARSDGTDVSWRIPRAYLGVFLTAKKGGEAVRTAATQTGMSYDLLLDPARRAEFLDRVEKAADEGRALLDAPSFPPGSYPLLIDFAMAKGLAHEAFGHAAETDGLDSSILGQGGKFRAGERFGGENVSIIDESIEGDNAYQPFSGNGVPRERTVILDHGVLKDALADVHTAPRAGTRLTGASRLASFAAPPIPRMSNIRIEVDDPFPIPDGKDFHTWTPEEVRDLLVEAGDLGEGARIVFLSGYRGGQVNPALGDFVFHCTSLFELTKDAVKRYKPGIFSGRIEAALHSIRRGYGPLRLDAAGTCGKAGQGVPSSGGSHHFVLMDENQDVRIGGRS